MLAFRFLARHIYNRTDCERFNIDNIEVRTGINVPLTLSYTCECGDAYKNSSFIIDTNHVNLKNFAIENNLILRNGIYESEGIDERTKWNASLDPQNAKLAFHIEYLGFAD